MQSSHRWVAPVARNRWVFRMPLLDARMPANSLVCHQQRRHVILRAPNSHLRLGCSQAHRLRATGATQLGLDLVSVFLRTKGKGVVDGINNGPCKRVRFVLATEVYSRTPSTNLFGADVISFSAAHFSIAMLREEFGGSRSHSQI